MTFRHFLLCHCLSALALALLLWQTPKISEFAQLNSRLHQTRGEGSYRDKATHGGSRGPQERARALKGPRKAPRGSIWLNITVKA